MRAFSARDLIAATLAVTVLLAVTAGYTLIGVTNPTIAALSMLLVVLVAATISTMTVGVIAAIAAMLCFNYFFLPPVHTFTIADPQNLVALFVFLAVSLVASNLSARARRDAAEAGKRRDEMTRLFDLTRDVLIAGEADDAKVQIARFIARRFGFDRVAICLPSDSGWQQFASAEGPDELTDALERVLASARAGLEFDAASRSYSGHVVSTDATGAERALVPLRLGTRPIGVLVTLGPACEPGTRDAIAGVAAIAIERLAFLDERRRSEVVQRSAELRRALFAAMSHDLRTPLTAMTVAATNLNAPNLDEPHRVEQAAIVLQQARRLNRLFQNIVDMARVEADAVVPAPEWGAAADIVEAARRLVDPPLDPARLRVIDGTAGHIIKLDPRLFASALAHVLENAAQYGPVGSEIDVTIASTAGELTFAVRDRGPGVTDAERAKLFDRFFRGTASSRNPLGSGLGLAIARGLMVAQHGRIWAENYAEGGAIFTLALPAETRRVES